MKYLLILLGVLLIAVLISPKFANTLIMALRKLFSIIPLPVLIQTAKWFIRFFFKR